MTQRASVSCWHPPEVQQLHYLCEPDHGLIRQVPALLSKTKPVLLVEGDFES